MRKRWRDKEKEVIRRKKIRNEEDAGRQAMKKLHIEI